MELVPFSEKWTGSETKLDLQAWYRRPAQKGFSVVGPFPLRRHSDYTRKGYEYITLATAEDVSKVVGELQVRGVDLAALRRSYDHMGHFKMADYLKTEQQKDDAYLVELQAKVDKFGAEVVTEMMRVGDADFVMPAGIKVPEAAKAKKAAVN